MEQGEPATRRGIVRAGAAASIAALSASLMEPGPAAAADYAVLGDDGHVGDKGGSPLSLSVVSAGSKHSPLQFLDAYGAEGDGKTNDGPAFQVAIDSISATGGGVLKLTPGKKYAVADIQPKSNVQIDAYGATVTMHSSARHGLVYDAAAAGVTSFGWYGGTLPGPGRNVSNTFAFVFRGARGLTFRDTVVSEWNGPFYMADCSDVQILFNKIYSCCANTGTGYNAINFVSSIYSDVNPDTGQDILVACNRLWDNPIENIAFVAAAYSPAGSQTFMRVMVALNNIELPSTEGYGIQIENASHQLIDTFAIVGNLIHCTGAPATGVLGIVIECDENTPPANQAIVNQRIHIANNTITGVYTGISVSNMAYSSIIGNDIFLGGGSAGSAIHVSVSQVAISFKGGLTRSSAVVANVSSTAVQDGMLISGTGVPDGTYVLSGGGTSVIVLSNPATVTQAGQTLGAAALCTGLTVGGNNCHIPAQAQGENRTAAGVSLSQVRDSAVTDNTFAFAPGSSGTGTESHGMSLSECGWLQIMANRITYAPCDGIYAQHCNALIIGHNFILNPGENAANNPTLELAFPGIEYFAKPGSPFTGFIVRENTIADDRDDQFMNYGITSSYEGLPTMNNLVSGAHDAAANNNATQHGV